MVMRVLNKGSYRALFSSSFLRRGGTCTESVNELMPTFLGSMQLNAMCMPMVASFVSSSSIGFNVRVHRPFHDFDLCVCARVCLPREGYRGQADAEIN